MIAGGFNRCWESSLCGSYPTTVQYVQYLASPLAAPNELLVVINPSNGVDFWRRREHGAQRSSPRMQCKPPSQQQSCGGKASTSQLSDNESFALFWVECFSMIYAQDFSFNGQQRKACRVRTYDIIFYFLFKDPN